MFGAHFSGKYGRDIIPMIHKRSHMIAICLSAVIAVGCSGGSGGVAPPATIQRIPSAASFNSAPVISGDPESAATVNQQYTFVPDASDPNGDNLTFLIENAPSWANFDSATGTLSGTPAPGDAATYDQIQISVSDGRASSSLPAFSITVTQNATGMVTLAWTAPLANTDGSPLTDLTAYRVRYGTEPGSYPERIEIANAGITTYVIENLAPNTYYFVLTSINSQNIESAFSNEASAIVR